MTPPATTEYNRFFREGVTAASAARGDASIVPAAAVTPANTFSCVLHATDLSSGQNLYICCLAYCPPCSPAGTLEFCQADAEWLVRHCAAIRLHDRGNTEPARLVTTATAFAHGRHSTRELFDRSLIAQLREPGS